MPDLKKAILMNKRDNVATMLVHIKKDEAAAITLNGEVVEQIAVVEAIEVYHKIAIRPIEQGELVYKYGEIIGKAVSTIKIGEHVHVNNIESVMTK
jgi:altronate dehydratase small subunit